MKKHSVTRSGLSHARILTACALVTVSVFFGYLAFATSAPNATDIQAAGLAPTNDNESAILNTLGPGNYTNRARREQHHRDRGFGSVQA